MSVAREIVLEDPFENEGAKLCRDVASKANMEVGDGTTTATVLANAMVQAGLRVIDTGANPALIRKGVQAALEAGLAEMKKFVKPVKLDDVDSLLQVATISGNDEEVGKIVSEAFDVAGKNSESASEITITLEESKAATTTIESREGWTVESGYKSPYFINNYDKLRVEYDDPYVLIFERKINNPQEVVKFIERIVPTRKPVVIFSDDIEGDALATFILNHTRGIIQCACVKTPGLGERQRNLLEDIAILCGAEFFSEDRGVKLDSVTVEQLGKIKKIIITQDSTTLVQDVPSERVKTHIAQLKTRMEELESQYDKEKYRERIGKLTSTIATIKIGAVTDAERREKKDRIEDAVAAIKAALEGGIVAGGGTIYLRGMLAVEELLKDTTLSEDERRGMKIVHQALKQPLLTIIDNAGDVSSEVILDRVLSAMALTKNPGYDARSNHVVADMFEAGIVDPAKVAQVALQAAVSVATLILQTETLVIDKPEEPKPSPEPGY